MNKRDQTILAIDSKKIVSVLLEVTVVALLTAALEWNYFGFQNIDWSAPISYWGDGLTGVWSIHKTLNPVNCMTGYPFFLDSSMFEARYSVLKDLFVFFCGVFTKNSARIFNTYLFVIPWFNVLVSYFSFKAMGIRCWLSYLAAVAFGFCPYVQARYSGHMALASIECIPLVLLLCVWCMEDERFEQWNRQGWKYKRNWIAMFFCWMIANNGMVYYPYFSCFLFLVLAVCLILTKRGWKAVCKPLLLIGQTVLFLGLGFIPTIVGMIAGVGNVAMKGAMRDGLQASVYAMRINALILSPHGYGLERLVNVYNQYNGQISFYEPFTYNENASAYMGIVAVLGFLLLLIILFSGVRADSKRKLSKRLWFFSRMNIAILLLAVTTGFSTLIGFLIPVMRCYNRISPFLVCLGVTAVTLAVEEGLSKVNGKRQVIFSVGVGIVFLFAIQEQKGCYGYLSGNDENKELTENDRAFVQQIEENAGEDGMIFQLPYMRSFENGPINLMQDYEHLRGPLYSKTLRWSYGAETGSENDIWYSNTSRLDPEEMVEELKAQGFSGIYLNLDGYEQDEGERLLEELQQASDSDMVFSDSIGRIYYIGID